MKHLGARSSGKDVVSQEQIGTGAIPLASLATSGASTNYVITYSGGVVTWAAAPGGGITDAPSDGKYYLRRNGGWENYWSARQALIAPYTFTNEVANWSNFTVFVRLPGHLLLATVEKWNFKIAAKLPSGSGSIFVGAIKILETALGSTAVLASTTVTIGGSATPTLSATTTLTAYPVDDVALPLRLDRDYWVAMYFTSGSNPTLGQGTIGGTAQGNFASANQTGTSTIPVAGTTTITGAYDFRSVP